MSEPVMKILAAYGEQDRSNIWQVQGTTVIKHSCLERVAAKADIAFMPPTVLRAEREEAVILVTGTMKDRSEWSIGEALVNVNYRVSGKQAAYVYAMAEKRAKDRVILKLIGLHGMAYSEEEADEFQARAQREPKAETKAPEPAEPPPGPNIDAFEVQLVQAAQRGVDALKAAWTDLPREAKVELKPAMDERFKIMAEEADLRRKPSVAVAG
jgi:hypothetical protein